VIDHSSDTEQSEGVENCIWSSHRHMFRERMPPVHCKWILQN